MQPTIPATTSLPLPGRPQVWTRSSAFPEFLTRRLQNSCLVLLGVVQSVPIHGYLERWGAPMLVTMGGINLT